MGQKVFLKFLSFKSFLGVSYLNTGKDNPKERKLPIFTSSLLDIRLTRELFFQIHDGVFSVSKHKRKLILGYDFERIEILSMSPGKVFRRMLPDKFSLVQQT